MLKVLAIFSLIVFISCNNQSIKEDKTIKQPTLSGLWKVKYVNETDFAIEGNDTLKGPFTDTAKNENITFTADSIIYYDGSDSIPKTNKYIYHKINDSVLYVLNVGYKDDSMRFYIHHLDTSKLLFTNIRKNEQKEERYEVTIECSRN